MRSIDVVGYAYEAALHCPDCTEKRFGDLDKIESVQDREGNTPSPVWGDDEPGDCGDYCNDCHEPLDNMPDDWDGQLLAEFIKDNRADMLAELTKVVGSLKASMELDPIAFREPFDAEDQPHADVRLCIDINHCSFGGTWIIRTGLVDYDQFHSEYCAAGSIGLDTDPADLLEDLISQLD